MKRFIDTHCRYTETYEPEHVYTFTGDCQVTGAPYSVNVQGGGIAFQDEANRQHDDAEVALMRVIREFSYDGKQAQRDGRSYMDKKHFFG